MQKVISKPGSTMKQLDLKPNSFFDIVATTSRSQAATMTLQPGQSTGGPDNQHENADQWLYVIAGTGQAVVAGQQIDLQAGQLLLIEAGETHEITGTGETPLETFSVYAPPAY